MKIDRISVAVCIVSQLFAIAAVAGTIEDNCESVEPINRFVIANIDWDIETGLDDSTPELIVAQNDDGSTEGSYDSTEEFYFGPDEKKVRAEIEKNRNTLDPIARAHRDMKIYMSAGLLVTAITMVILGLIHTDKELPRDLYAGRQKYEKVYGEDNPIPLVINDDPYIPSIAAGISLAAGSVFLLLKK